MQNVISSRGKNRDSMNRYSIFTFNIDRQRNAIDGAKVVKPSRNGKKKPKFLAIDRVLHYVALRTAIDSAKKNWHCARLALRCPEGESRRRLGIKNEKFPFFILFCARLALPLYPNYGNRDRTQVSRCG